MKFTLRQLQVFLAVAHHENVTQAAGALALSQSAVSTALKQLEQHFNILLFDRLGKRLKLSEQGAKLRPQAESLMAQARQLEVQLLQGDDVGELKIGATLTIGNYLAIGIMANFMSGHPQARIELTVENTAAIANRVKNFEIDIGLIEGELQDPRLTVLPWRDDELVLFCSPKHTLAGKSVLTDQDLIAAQWIVRERGSGTRQAFDRAMAGLLSDLQLRLELQHTEGIKRAVEAGLGLGCLSRISLREAFQRGSLVELKAPQRQFDRKFYFILHEHKFLSPGIKSWIDYCHQYTIPTPQ